MSGVHYLTDVFIPKICVLGILSQRGQYGEERYEKIDFQLKVREKFMQLKSEDESEGNIPWHVLDARKSIEEIQAEIQAIADKTMETVGDKPIRRLWLNKE